MRKHQDKKNSSVNEAQLKIVLGIILLVLCLVAANYARAEDLLAGTDGAIKDTVKGTLKKYVYIIDGAISAGMFMYTKKPSVFFSTAALAGAFTVILKLAGFA